MHVDLEVACAMYDHLNPALYKHGPLEHKSGQDEVEPNGTVAVLFQECHQKSEADKHHTVHIHEHFNIEVNKNF